MTGRIVTRIAPSPTGYLHFGLARTALFSYLYARKSGGEYIVRIEDTDAARNKPEYEADILEQLKWLNLEGDRFYRQSEHRARHAELLQSLIEKDLAYLSKEPSKDDPEKIVEVIRLRNSGERVAFDDLIHGHISFDTTELGDFIIARSINDPVYHFAVVVDDHDEGVTHIIRGEDHISNTPRQILIHRALGFEIPVYTHIPLILMPDKSKMSKRKHESSVKNFREEGFLAQALINYVALLGWNPGTEQELFSMDELIAAFEMSHIHKSGAVFDLVKLRWFNREYLKNYSDTEFKTYIDDTFATSLNDRNITVDDSAVSKLLPTIRARISTLDELRELVEGGEFDFFSVEPKLDPAILPGKGSDAATARKHLEAVKESLMKTAADEFANPDSIKNVIWDYANEQGRASVLWPLRYALSGRERSPDPFTLLSLLGKDTSLKRIDAALQSV